MVRLGIVGHGSRVSSFVKHCLRAETSQEVRVAGIVDPDHEGARSRLDDADREAVFYDALEDMVRAGGLDGIMIGTRCNLHASYAAEAA